jgi:hypothetical protein
MAQAPERSTVGIEITMKDADGVNILPGAITAFLLEVRGTLPGLTNPIAALTSTVIPTSNPQLYVLDLTGLDRDAVGDRLKVEYKITYTSTTLGAGAVLRSEEPFVIHLTNSELST